MERSLVIGLLFSLCHPAISSAQYAELTDLIANGKGEYAAQVSPRTGFYVDYTVSVTDAGILIAADAMMTKCSYVVDAETGKTFALEARGRCDTGEFRGERSGSNIVFAFDGSKNTITLPLVSGAMGDRWIQHVPEAAVIKGIRLGSPAPSSVSDTPGYGALVNHGPLSKFSRSSIGMMGVTNTNFFERANYLHASESRPIGSTGMTISFDDVAIYSVDGIVAAVMRYQSPPAEEAPRYDAVQEALIKNYGQPTESRRSGAGIIHEWHFDSRGDPAGPKAARACGFRFNGDRNNSRNIILQRQEIDAHYLDIVAGRPARITQKTDTVGLRASIECGYSIQYHTHPTRDGFLDYMRAVMYAHDPVRTEIWTDRGDALTQRISQEIERHKDSSNIKPDL